MNGVKLLQQWKRVVRRSALVLLGLTVMLSVMPGMQAYANSGFAGGDGSEETPYLIADEEQFNRVRDDPWDHYKLIADIDLSAYRASDGGRGWAPIAAFYGMLDGDGHTITGLSIQRDDTENVGLFGTIYSAKIANLNILQANVEGASRTGIVVGTAANAVLDNVYVSGSVTGEGHVGGLVGELQTTSARQVGSSAHVHASSNNIGGLFGYVILMGQEINGCYAEGDVESTGDSVGGLVGMMSGGVIKQCYATGNVSGSASVGGLIGWGASSYTPPATIHEVVVEDSFALGSVSGGNVVGGLIGSTREITITNSYAAGAVHSSGFKGGFAGYSHDSTVAGSFWNVDSSRTSYGYGWNSHDPGVIGLTTEDMLKQSKYAGWNFSGTWAMTEDSSYPYLRHKAPLWLTNLSVIPDAGTTGSLTPSFKSAARQYQISVTNEAASATIDASAADSGAIVTTVGGEALSPGIQTAIVTVADSSGIRASQVYQITINKLSSSNISSDATLAEIKADGVAIPNFDSGTMSYSITVGCDLENVNITAVTTDSGASYTVSGNDDLQPGSNTVTIRVTASDGTIKTYTLEIIRSKFAGGEGTAASPYLVATPEQFNAIRDSDAYQKEFRLVADIDLSAYASANGGQGWEPIYLEGVLYGDGHRITGLTINRPNEDNVGLFNYIYLGKVYDLEIVQASVKGRDKVGILTGWHSSATSKNVHVSGQVTGRHDVGGLTGYNTGSIQSSASVADVAGSGNAAGGLVGQNLSGVVNQSYATGTVRSNSQAGGLIGYNNNGTVSNSFATGEVTAISTAGSAGGLIGQNRSGTHTNNYAVGKVVGGTATGGLIGARGTSGSAGTFSNNYWNTTTSGRSNGTGSGAATGLTGRTNEEMKARTSFAAAWNFIDTWNIINGTTTPYLRSAPLPIWLTGLTVTTGTGDPVSVTPVADNLTSAYQAVVSANVNSVTVSGTTLDSSNVITVNGGSALVTGDNTITVKATAANGLDSRTYTLIVKRADASVTGLNGLTLSAGTLSPVFDQATTAYNVSVPYGTAALNVTPTATYSGSTIKVNGASVTSGQPSGNIALAAGENTTVNVAVTSQDGSNTKVYAITVTRGAASANANLSAMTISAGTLTPGFSAATTAYTASVNNGTASMTVRPTVADSSATVEVQVNNGTPVAVSSGQNSPSLGLNVGSNTIVVTVTAQNGSTKEYRITVTRAASAEAGLSGLSLSAGTLSPSFNSNTNQYSSSVDNGVSNITVKPVAMHTGATITASVNDGTPVSVSSDQFSNGLPLNTGVNKIELLVTAQDGTTTRTYTINVTRAKSSERDLTAFSFQGLTPAVTGTIDGTDISLNVPYGTNRSALIASFTHSEQATVTVGAAVQISGTTPNNFNTPVIYTVTAEDGSTKAYTVTVHVGPSSEKAITAYSLAEQTDAAVIDSAAHTVSINVASGTDLRGLITTFSLSEDASAKVGTANQSSGVTANDFTNPVIYTVTAADGSVQSWTVHVQVATPAAPVDLSHSGVSSTGWLQTWSTAAGATGYNIYVDGTKVNASLIAGTSYQLTGLASGTGYTVKVTAVNDSGEGEASTAYSVTTITEAPTNLSHSEVTSTGWLQSWAAVEGAEGYNIYVDGIKLNTSPTTETSYEVKDRTPGTTYNLQVTAVNDAGESLTSDAYHVTTIPAAPTGLAHSGMTSTGWKQSWSHVTGATGYHVYVDGNKMNVSLITDNDFQVTGRRASTTYSVKVTAVNGAGESVVSDAYSVTTSAASAPDSSTGTDNDPIQVNTTDGKLTLYPGEAGSTRLGDEIIIIVPQGAWTQKLELTVEKVLHTASLIHHNEKLASPVFEVTKNVSENLKKPVTVIIQLNPEALKRDQALALHYYDEQNKRWVEIGGKVEGDTLKAEVYHFGKFAVLAKHQQDEEPLSSFIDIAGHWAEASIKKAVMNRMVKGFPDGTFKPNAFVTRAEFAVMLMNALMPQGEGAPLSFTDKEQIGAWAQTSVAQAVQAGIISGYADGSFRPNAQINRAEMVLMIARAIEGAYPKVAETAFADDSSIPDWAKAAIEAIRKLGIISGREGNRFMPNDKATRAESVTVILRLLEKKE
ncbi:cadherin-like beta sandwich domain-containing protein [Paenibacillus paeoniae]|uniref:S-layer homology domain-containing protein n=1 Tax=Paenibacillus paeoniae TaxID=2292705 RepID=A0A371PIG8_9BACL|nr:cadherin-like beta sandwich domain-containing protein [Paenibacillus paeoniae]REK75587.1 hypothetical protein DX130_00380 [Paenibacillus paeoniae]